MGDDILIDQIVQRIFYIKHNHPRDWKKMIKKAWKERILRDKNFRVTFTKYLEDYPDIKDSLKNK